MTASPWLNKVSELTAKRLEIYRHSITAQTADLPPMVVEQVIALSAKYRVDLNTCVKHGKSYLIGEPRTRLTIRADRNGARFGA